MKSATAKLFCRSFMPYSNRVAYFFIVEPMIHIKRRNFEATLDMECKSGFIEVTHPHVAINRSVILTK
jgi:hypothetical protein